MKRLRAMLGRLAPLLGFRGSRHYWEMRYRIGGHSGEGSRGRSAAYKAQVLNDFIQRHGVRSAIEFGCGDGYQLNMLRIGDYTGVDVSETILRRCREMFANDPTKRFVSVDEYRGERSELSMSLDVIFHLVEDAVYDEYLERLFSAGERFVIVYSTNAEADTDKSGLSHVRHRPVVDDIAHRFPDFERMATEEEALPEPVRFDRGLPTRFFIYARKPSTGSKSKP